MPRLKPIQMSMTNGEISGRLHSRYDLAKYFNSVETLENFIILPQGGITRRPGWHFVKEVMDSTRKTRLIPFVFSTEQAYIIEAGQDYFRFYMNHGQICSPDAYTKLLLHGDGLNASTTITDSSGGGHSIEANGNAQINTSLKKYGSGSIWFGGTGDFLHIGDHADFDLSGGIFTVEAWILPLAVGQVRTIYFQDAGVATDYISLHLTAGSAPWYQGTLTFKIVAGGVTKVLLEATRSPVVNEVWHHVAVVENGNNYYLFLDGYMEDSETDTDRPANYTSDVAIGSGYAGADGFAGYIDEIRVSKASARWTANFAPPTHPYPLDEETTPTIETTTYLEEELPKLKWAQSADTLWIVNANHKPAKLTRSSHVAWSLDDVVFTAMPDWSVGKGWPEACAFHEQRFCYAGTVTYPQTVWFSQSGDYDNFTTGTADDVACIYTVPAEMVDMIVWLSTSTRGLLIGSGGGLFSMDGGTTGITPTNIGVHTGPPERCYDVMPLRIGSTTIFLQKFSRKIRELAYQWQDDSWHSPDLTVLAEHITLGGVSYLAYQQEPYSIIWATRQDGVLLTQAYLREEDVLGWGRHITDGVAESIAVIPDPTGSFDEIWAIIKRTIGGVDKRYIEYMDPDMPVDSGITYSGAPVSAVSNLDHLIGKTVHIVGDGIVRTPQIVDAGGAVTVDGPAASLIYVGLPYTSKVVTLRPNVNIGSGTTAGLPKKWAECWVDLLETSGVTINNEVVPFRKVGDLIGAAVVPFTGEKRVSQLGWNEGRITITQEQPLPCTIRTIHGILEFGD